MPKLLLLIIIPFITFGQCPDEFACNYSPYSYNFEDCWYPGVECQGDNGFVGVVNSECECVGCEDVTACNYGSDPAAAMDVFDMITGQFWITQVSLECAYPGNDCLWIDESLDSNSAVEYVVYGDVFMEPEDAIFYSGIYNDDCECICNINTPIPIIYLTSWGEFWMDTIFDCSTEISIREIPNKKKQLITTVDILGKETTNKGFQLHIYDDGTVEKKYIIK